MIPIVEIAKGQIDDALAENQRAYRSLVRPKPYDKIEISDFLLTASLGPLASTKKRFEFLTKPGADLDRIAKQIGAQRIKEKHCDDLFGIPIREARYGELPPGCVGALVSPTQTVYLRIEDTT